MSRSWSNALTAWLHAPPDKCFGIVGHEARARRYLEAALGRAVTQDEHTHVAAVPASAGEHLPLPPGDDSARSADVEGGLKTVHPLSARSDSVEVDVVDDDDLVINVIREIAAPWADAQDRFLALWRFLPERLAKERPYFDVLPADARTPDHTIWQHLDATAALAGGHGDGDAAFLSFSLGPVQSFIAAARSLRDLWSGSMILSWLTFKAMLPVIDRLGPTALVYPAVRGLPLLDLWLDRKLHIKRNLPDFLPAEDADARRAPCLPNRFLAVVPYGSDGGEARELAEMCHRSARNAWANLCEAVRQALDNKSAALDADWHSRWHEQVDNYFEVRTAVLPWSKCDDPTLAELLRAASDFWKTTRKSARRMENFAAPAAVLPMKMIRNWSPSLAPAKSPATRATRTPARWRSRTRAFWPFRCVRSKGFSPGSHRRQCWGGCAAICRWRARPRRQNLRHLTPARLFAPAVARSWSMPSGWCSKNLSFSVRATALS